MIPFLKSVATAYLSRYSDLSEFCFLFPNKRSGTFFLKYLQEECGRHIMIAPEVKSIAEFVSELSDTVIASRLDLVFMLYDAYKELLGVHRDGANESVSFDEFRSWGETVLSDFNEVDLYLVNHEEIFKNVKDFREIASNFLTEDQKRVMAEYFGRTEAVDSGGFWKNFDAEEEDLSEVKKRFLHLWRILSPLYEALNRRLSAKGLSTTGGSYRIALDKLKEKGKAVLPYKKVVAIGFNALSTAENAIFRELKEQTPYPGMDTFVDFFWDATGPVLSCEDNSASKFVRANIKNFPAPEWALPSLSLSHTEKLPDVMKVAASPSNSAQTKIAGMLLSDLGGRLKSGEFRDAKVAVVLPDENLLLPMLYSLPAGMGDVNLTMGYSLRLTSVVPFVTLLRRLHHNMRDSSGEKGYYHRDIRLFLAHPFSFACFGGEVIRKINGFITRHHKAVITRAELSEISPDVVEMIDGLPENATPMMAVEYLDRVLGRVTTVLEKGDNGLIKSRLEISHIQVYRDSLRRMRELLEEYPEDMDVSTVFLLIDRLISGESVGFEGEPLTGLQVMGMLETRSIDFDYIFILSANERILPMKARRRSFIPDTLRRAFGMPPSNYAEGIFAYYFYRMISRAKEVYMVYDARSGGGMRSGDVSRYILQLRHLFAKDRLMEEDWKFILSGKNPSDPSVEKNKEIMERLDAFMSSENGLNFSASSLNAYRECEVRFFYQSVLGLNSDPEPSEYIDSISAGNILHELMLELYLPKDKRKRYLDNPEEITARKIDSIINDKERLWKTLTRVVNRLHFRRKEEHLDTPLTGGALLVASQIERQARMVLRHDRSLSPFRIFGCEISEKMRITLSNGRVVNFKFAIDRLDEIDKDGKKTMRIVDYKTGKIKLEAETFDKVMAGGYESEQIFQLFTYAWLLEKLDKNVDISNLRLEIYDVPNIHKGETCIPVIEGEEVERYGEYRELFSEGMEEMINGIFDNPEFLAVEDAEACSKCRLRQLCHR